jgi:hypothetical protein
VRAVGGVKGRKKRPVPTMAFPIAGGARAHEIEMTETARAGVGTGRKDASY